MKILILGERNTGKSSYIKTLLNMDNQEYIPTNGILIAPNLNLPSNKGNLQFDIYDCSIPIGTELNFDDIVGVLLFFDCTRMCDINSWIQYARKFSCNIILCNNKIELNKHEILDTSLFKYLDKNTEFTTLSCYKKWCIDLPLEKIFKLHFNDYQFSLGAKSGKDEIFNH